MIKNIKKYSYGIIVIICAGMTTSKVMAQNENKEQADLNNINPLTQQEIDQALAQMKVKMFKNLENWSTALKRNDFERTGKNLVLKSNKQLELCHIYQASVDETYSLAQKNRHRMSIDEQKIVDDRNRFIEYLGFKDNQIDTKLGFSCRLI
ncbi:MULTISPECIES: hypothetical protein [unclassified Acinetobacter]|uniref:hypothetical protein n=1 Tax=unclassified Acinetobacter TaxID=196816 RepID=UPI0008D4A6DB|nr:MULTISPECIES: hypothetical protein [unclassified Acinetobacter]SEL76429.1 hypothetical protein SAMN05216500_105119 [Acinetobacter sp. DSM 11652]